MHSDQHVAGAFFFCELPPQALPPRVFDRISGRKIFGANFKAWSLFSQAERVPGNTRRQTLCPFNNRGSIGVSFAPSSPRYASSLPKMVDVKKDASKQEDEFAIKPQAVTPALDTSNWPLLLKNYDKRTMASSDFTLP